MLTHTPDTSSPRETGVVGHLLARWPSVAGLLALVLNASGGVDSHVTAFIIVIASTCYLAAAALGSQRSGWVMVGVASLAIVGARLIGLDPTVTMLVMGAAFALWGLMRPGLTSRWEVGAQTLAFVVFSAIALAAMMSGPLGAGLLAAAAAIGHAGWDVLHFVRDKVVPRSLSEACFVLDLGLGLLLLVVTLGAAG